MTEKSQAELENLHNSVVDFGRLAVGMLRESIDAFEAGDIEKADNLSATKSDLKSKFLPLEDALFQYLALYHPVAKDMRECVASIRIIYNLERVGRMGYDIAETTSVLSRCCGLRESETLIEMGRLVIGMVDDAITAYDEHSTSRITTMAERDKDVDCLYCKILREFITRMQEEKDAVPVLTRYVIIDRYLERCGDQACNIAEMVLYMVTGERIEIT